MRYIALTTVVDDICVPPLDLLDGSFRIYGRCARDLVEAMEREGWGRDGTHVLLSLVRQYLMQYAEKVSAGVHAELSRSAEVWDSVVYRTHTANTYAAAVVIARVTGCGPLTTGWIMDSAICDAISMDLCKSATQVYQQDDHQPTRGPLEAMRHIGYHSAYLDLMDDLVYTGAPEPLVHFGRAGFLFVQLQDRYQERAAGRRFPIRPAMARLLRSLFGDAPTDTRLDKLFHPRGRSDSVRD
ncbi:hypothetical protein DMH03_40700 [Amycolatopsis sp. WAC 01376]|nr:hypothetical protein DMH03_40700 [Amycolatopsis sp. WAC 01376]